MNFDDFKTSLSQSQPLESLPSALKALWWDAKGDWDKAHAFAQEQDDSEGAWAHAYLHRKEGDTFNASYWYRRADKPHAKVSLSEEWAEIAKALCD
jgi:hypothetical protein